VKQLGGHRVALAESFDVPRHGGGKTEVVEQRRMQEVRQIADGVKRTVRD